MKIAFVLGGSTYQQSLYRVTYDVAEEIRRQGYQVDYIFWEYPGSLKGNDKYLKIFGLNKESRLSRIFSKFFSAILGLHFYQYLFSPLFSIQLKSQLEAEKYDSVFYHGQSCIPLRADKKKHYVVVHSCKHENFITRYSGVRRYFYALLYKKIYSDRNLLTVSNDVLTDMVHKIGARPKSIEVIYNGFDFERLKAETFKPKSYGLPDSFIMSAGRPDRTKRFDVLLRAYSKSKKNYPLVIFGDGRLLNKLKQLAEELSLSNEVIFAGFNNNILPALRQAKLYVSSSDVEGLPTVIIESLAAGTPVVATDAGGSYELLNNSLSRWVVPRGDADALARAIDSILENPPGVSSESIAFLDHRRIAKRYINLGEQLKGYQH
jgi:glycosyltransferase involved in cell wall biosynthesis